MEQIQSKNPLLKKLRGYQKADKGRIKLLTDKVLSHEEYILFEICIAITDWDRDHETYGLFKATNLQLAEIAGWDSDSTVSRYRKSLVEKGFLSDCGNGCFKAKNFEDWQLRRGEVAKNQDVSADLQPSSAEIQTYPAKMQKDRERVNDYSLGSFKGNSSFANEALDIDEISRELDKQS